MTQGFAREARLGVDLHVGETLYYTANDTFTKASYSGLYGVRVKAQGAGGGGGGSAGAGTGAAAGAGGGGGGYAEAIIVAADLGTSETITVGTGGSGGAAGNNAGSAGGNSSFGTHAVATAGGGGGGMSSGTSSKTATAGAGGIGTAGDMLLAGTDGGHGQIIGSWPTLDGRGGAGLLSGERWTAVLPGAGGDGKQYGGGGSGGRSTTANSAGGDGADGIVIVEVLYERKIAVDEDIHTQYLNETRHDADDHSALLTGFDIASTTLTDDNVAAIDTREQWGTEEAVISDPGQAVKVTAMVVGNVNWNSGSASRRVSQVQLQISFDGGSSWDSGDVTDTEVRGSDQRRATVAALHFKSGTPTGDIQARVLIEQSSLGTAGDLVWQNGVVQLIMVPG